MQSLLVDPVQVWQPEIGAFTDGGDPSFALLASAARLGLGQAAPARVTSFIVPGADQRYEALLREFRRETGELTGESLAAACRCPPGGG